jgi:hypothetical protein
MGRGSSQLEIDQECAMAVMSPHERVIRTFEGKPVDRVPTFCAGIEDRTFNEVLGRPLISMQAQLQNPVTRFLLDRWGPALTKPFFQPAVNASMKKRIKATVVLGFDATWGVYEETFIVLDSRTMARFTGSIFNLQEDGFGNMTYMYRGPGIRTREEFEAWPYWPVPDEVAHRAFDFYKQMMSRYGDRICLFGQASAYGIQESLLWTLGFERFPLWIKKEPDLVKRYISFAEELCLKTSMAMLDAGVPVILQSDDFAYKTGPFLNPALIEDLFGPSYRRIITAVHERGGKYVLHSCGDNTPLFDMLIKWGVDGLHAYETTSNVDIFHEKRVHGEQVTIIGGVGIDYLLTDRSSDEEVEEAVKEIIRKLAPGGRFIIAPIHSVSSIPAHKLRVMLEAVNRFGSYPIES